MTAQIGVINKRAIVLATDSAVTIQTNANESKVYNSVNKLFALSKIKPIAIMIYGNAELFGVPWETLAKVHRKQLKQSYKTLEGYSDNFINWLEKNAKKLFPEKFQNHYLESALKSFLNFILMEPIKQEMKKMLEGEGEVKEKKILSFVENKVTEIYKASEKKSFVNDFNKSYLNSFKKRHRKVFKKVIDSFIVNLKLKKGSIDKLYAIAGSLFVKDIFSNNYSGVVIAGFGDEDLYPTLVEFQVEAVVDNKIKYKQKNKIKIKAEGCTAAITPFAQTDIMHNFLLGIHPANIGYFEKILKSFPKVICEHLIFPNDAKKKEIEQKVTKKNKEIFDEFIKAINMKFAKPVIEMIGLMPITEMCEFAESLVNLTSLRKKVTMQNETVGGATEVISITKGEGLIWIKRKHYFDPKLNPGFVNNYLNI